MQAIQASQFEDLFEEHLRYYDSDRDMLAQEQRDQDQVSEQVRQANQAFTRAHKGDTSTREREMALQDLENGYMKYKEIISNLEVGRKFYNDLAKIVGRFRDDGKAFVHQRRMEASQLEAWVLATPAFQERSLTDSITETSKTSPPCRHCTFRNRTFANRHINRHLHTSLPRIQLQFLSNRHRQRPSQSTPIGQQSQRHRSPHLNRCVQR